MPSANITSRFIQPLEAQFTIRWFILDVQYILNLMIYFRPIPNNSPNLNFLLKHISTIVFTNCTSTLGLHLVFRANVRICKHLQIYRTFTGHYCILCSILHLRTTRPMMTVYFQMLLVPVCVLNTFAFVLTCCTIWSPVTLKDDWLSKPLLLYYIKFCTKGCWIGLKSCVPVGNSPPFAMIQIPSVRSVTLEYDALFFERCNPMFLLA